MKPDYDQIMVPANIDGSRMRPLDALSEIVPGLYQGFRPATYVGYDLVVSCEQFLAKKPMEGYTGITIHLPMRDEDDFVIPTGKIAAAVSAIAEIRILDEGKALVHCTGGLNRSSLVTAEYLKLTGLTPREAVEHLRRARDPFVLCNRHFERWVLEEPLPTAETSTFNVS